jgi:hypothetical protein
MTALSNPHGDEPGHPLAGTLLYNVVYCSRAAASTDAQALDRIISTSQRWNPARAITGVLVFGSGVFFQWLEGPRANVTGLLERIKADPRHQDLVVLNEDEDVRDRLFPNWAMELVTSDAIRDVLLDAQDTVQDSAGARALQSLLNRLDAGELSTAS